MATEDGERAQVEQEGIHSQEADTMLEEEHHRACHGMLDLAGTLGVQSAESVDMDIETDCGSGRGLEAVGDEVGDALGSVAGAERQAFVWVG